MIPMKSTAAPCLPNEAVLMLKKLWTVMQISDLRKSMEKGQMLQLTADQKTEDEEQQLGNTMLAAYWAAVNDSS